MKYLMLIFLNVLNLNSRLFYKSNYEKKLFHCNIFHIYPKPYLYIKSRVISYNVIFAKSISNDVPMDFLYTELE